MILIKSILVKTIYSMFYFSEHINVSLSWHQNSKIYVLCQLENAISIHLHRFGSTEGQDS